ncbi:hypothetical protein FJ251_11785, partial [bacterium]|nr:hypothetical protein [bacterium]
MRNALRLALALLTLAPSVFAAPFLEYLDSGQWTFNQDVAVQGTRAAVSLSYGLQLWELSDPAAPLMLGDYYLDGYRAWAVAWEGDLVAVTSAVGHLYLIDVGDPEHPVRVDRLQGLGSNADLALVRDGATRWCYSAGNATNDFQIRDLTNPAASVLRGGLNLAGQPNGIAVLGDIALMSARTVGLYAVNVSNPDAPLLVDTETLSGTHGAVAADGTRAAVGSGVSGFTLFDVSNPANPVRRATVNPAAGAWSGLDVREVIVHGTMLWAICFEVGALAYDISDLDNPVLVGYDPRLDITPPQAPPYYFFNEGVYAGGRLYLSSWSGFTAGCIVLDAASSGMDYLGRALGFDYVRDVDEANGFVYGCTGQMGIFAHQHVSPNQFVPRGHFHVVESWGVKAYGSTVYVASTTEGLVVGDFSDPDNPVRRDDLDLGQGRQLVVEDGIAYVAAYTQGFHTVDVTDPDHLVALDAVTRPNMRAINIDKAGSLVVTSDQADGMNLWNVADPADIQHIANWPTPGQALDVALSPDGAYAYLAVAGQGVQVIDVSPPTSPTLVATLSAGGVTGLQLADGYLHVSRGEGGVRSFHQSGSPAAPVELASFDTTHNAWNVCAGMQDG